MDKIYQAELGGASSMQPILRPPSIPPGGVHGGAGPDGQKLQDRIAAPAPGTCDPPVQQWLRGQDDVAIPLVLQRAYRSDGQRGRRASLPISLPPYGPDTASAASPASLITKAYSLAPDASVPIPIMRTATDFQYSFGGRKVPAMGGNTGGSGGGGGMVTSDDVDILKLRGEGSR